MRGPTSLTKDAPVALIDGDVVVYQVASVCQAPVALGSEEMTFREAEVRQTLRQVLDQWQRKAGARERIVLLSGAANFRKLVDPTYKANRAGIPKPVAWAFARKVLFDEHAALHVEGLEADDLLGLMLTGSMADGRGIAVSIDKDLKTVPGLHCNPNKDTPIFRVTAAQADRWWMEQTLTGDATDGYGGARGVGPTVAAKLLTDGRVLRAVSRTLTRGPNKGKPRTWWVAEDKGTPWQVVVSAYLKAGMTEADALRTARLARILRTGDYDKTTREVRLWHPTSPSRLTLPSGSPNSSTPSGPDPSSERSASSPTP